LDELHQLRTGGELFIALDALAHLALLKVFMTATPFVEGPKVSVPMSA
jgi:hypothetical protein